MIHKNPQSPQHECEPSYHGVGFFPWRQHGALGLTKLQTSGFACCRALGWGGSRERSEFFQEVYWGWT